MKRFSALSFVLFISIFTSIQAQPKEEFKQRREIFIQKMTENSVAVFKNAPAQQGVGEYRSSSNFYYLTGWTEPNAILFLFKKPHYISSIEKSAQEVFLIQTPRGRRAVQYDGASAAPEDLIKDNSFESVTTVDKYEELLNSAFSKYETVYLEMPRSRSNQPVTQEQELINNAKEKQLSFEVESPRNIIAEMRSIKSPAELEILKKAIEITCQAHREVMRSAEPGMYEYELQSILEYVFHRNGAVRPGFSSIVGSGPNALVLHYSKNIRKMQPNELVVLDIGAEYHMYTGDVTRTIPTSGKFTPAQAELYQLVLDMQKASFSVIKPGGKFRDITAASREVLQDAGFGKYLPHGVSHPIGLDVHDVNGWNGELKEGMVITVEPGIYIPEGSEDVDAKYWNIGIRIEDDVLVTKTGYEILSGSAPKEIKDVETLMKETGVGNYKLK